KPGAIQRAISARWSLSDATRAVAISTNPGLSLPIVARYVIGFASEMRPFDSKKSQPHIIAMT
ncbi:hypothetical protein, partial [Pseudomonas sp. TJI-51]|uniref:hypothetical protein n=1 Tax=Pseudomonas sp. (strain TJI-51) TaxID=985010 RepID=UPI001C48C017